MNSPCGPDVTALTGDQLEDQLRRHAAHLAAAECDFLELLAEFDRREEWAGWGMRSAAHWLSLHCGMRLGAARERVRVARCLTQLPSVHEAFSAGRLSYCKVRALTRVATPITEQALVEIALGATGAQLERVVRQWRTTLVEEMSASSQLRRSLRRREDIDGSVIYTLRVAPEDAASLDAAIDAARRVVLDDNGQPVETPEETRLAAQLTDEPPVARAGADAVVLLADTFLAESIGAGRAPIEIVIHADLAGLPALVDPDPGLTAGAGHHAAEPPAPTLRPPGARALASGHSLAQRVSKVRPPTCFVEGGGPLAPSTVTRLLCEAAMRVMVSEYGNPLDLGRAVRHANRRQRRALSARDGCCRFPGCTQAKRLIPHHVRWWSHGGPTDMDNLVMLCPSHHRAVHEVGYTIAVLGAGRFAFYRPDGVLLPDIGPPVPDTSDDFGERPVDGTTISPTWGGERLDMDMLISTLAANFVNAAGHELMTIPSADLPAVLRESVQWPLEMRPCKRTAAA